MQVIAEKIKSFVHSELYVVAVLVLVGLGSFALGRMSSPASQESGVRIIQPTVGATPGMNDARQIGAAASAANSIEHVSGMPAVGAETGQYVASRNGTKYHYPWCSGAQRINEENKIWFATIEEARAAGYEPAKNCKGLK